MVRVISKKINPYGLVVNGEQIGVNYDDLISNEIMVNDENTAKISNYPYKSKHFQLLSVE